MRIQQTEDIFAKTKPQTGIFELHVPYSTGRGKAVPLQALTGPEGSRRLMLPDFKTIGSSRWKGCHPYAPADFTPRKYSW
jgi:hypothetical protein